MSARAHAVFDSDSLKRQVDEALREAAEAERIKALRTEFLQFRHVDELDAANLEKQSGRRLSRAVLEEKLKKLVPNLVFDTFEPVNSNTLAFAGLKPGQKTRRVFLQHPDGTLEYLSGASFVDAPVIPEWSVIVTRRVVRKDPSMLRKVRPGKKGLPNETRHIDRKDLPRTIVTDDGTGVEHVAFDGLLPHERYVNEPVAHHPGWRSVGFVLIVRGLCSVERFELEFGAGNREGWAVRLGKQRATRQLAV